MHSISRPWHLVQPFIVSHTHFPPICCSRGIVVGFGEFFAPKLQLKFFSRFITLITAHVHIANVVNLWFGLHTHTNTTNEFHYFRWLYVSFELISSKYTILARIRTHRSSTCRDLCGLSFWFIEILLDHWAFLLFLFFIFISISFLNIMESYFVWTIELSCVCLSVWWFVLCWQRNWNCSMQEKIAFLDVVWPVNQICQNAIARSTRERRYSRKSTFCIFGSHDSYEMIYKCYWLRIRAHDQI